MKAGKQTQLALKHFNIGSEKIPLEAIYAIALIKKSAAKVNTTLGVLPSKKSKEIIQVCEKILSGALDNEFPLHIWQSGSGTQTNMNVNEAIVQYGKKADLHPNDDVNLSQSSNDVFPTVMHISAYQSGKTMIASVIALTKTFEKKSKEFSKHIKVGRTHLMDAVPITMGQEYSGYAAQLTSAQKGIEIALNNLLELPIGGTAVGTGLNAPRGFDIAIVKELQKETGYKFTVAENKFELMSAHDRFVALSSAYKVLAIALTKIANDIRLASSGPVSGFNEIHIPQNEPGSSIMPGKVNPSQAEALIMICAQVIGLDTAITTAALNGHFQLNVSNPLIIYDILTQAKLLGDGCASFNTNCVIGIQPNLETLKRNLENSLINVTALNKRIGYDMGAKLVAQARKEHKTLKQVVLENKLLTEKEFNALIDFKKMV